MRLGRISVVASLAALIGAILPVVVGSFVDGLPQPIILFAFVLAFIAVILIAREKDEGGTTGTNRYLYLPIFAGIGFGLYFVLIHEASQEFIIVPLIIARASGTMSTALYILFKRKSFRIKPGSWHLLTLNSLFDVGGNVLYVLAAQVGRLDISAVLSSLYPGITIFLAWLILKEKMQLSQWVGIILALIAIVLITIA